MLSNELGQIRRVDGLYWRGNNAIFNIVAASNENTVVTEYEPVKSRSDYCFLPT